ncbi:T9SS type A sorting domain-containing protein [Hymenobacter sp. BT188]|uniref:GDSL-type esterase/lipase family protein n=1 Tax=Hymenobacter sp. BT188 TaxID=2763504 RepID=UPI001651AC97|nr:GDSL-type esterase/lipase family protein [Hymenobacter sp. BT188]MBC6608913.1 T9SS type A sorting domain-containing protein [Hymenobacter sp. BT188]
MKLTLFNSSTYTALVRTILPVLRGLLLGLFGLLPTYAQTPAKIKIMPLGDSITQGDTELNSYRRALWKKLLTDVYNVDFVGGQILNDGGAPPDPDFDRNHEGHSGRTADWLSLYSKEWATSFQPDIVLLHAGTNDLISGQSAESTRNDIALIIEQLRSVNPSVKVLLAQIIPSVYENINVNIAELNGLLSDLAKEKNTEAAPVILVDQNTGFSTEPKVDLYDEVHPNARGEEKMAERWYQALKTVLGKPLPVNLVRFNARPLPVGVQLEWATASEQNNVGFTIERSRSGTQFTPVGQVDGRGNTASRTEYAFVDLMAPSDSKSYYRLRQTDTNGDVRFSGIVTVSPAYQSELIASPIPADRMITVSGIVSPAPITIWNGRGQVVDRQVAESTQITLDISQLSQGLYYLQAGTKRVRFIKH